MDAQTTMQLKVMTLELAARTLGSTAHPADIIGAAELFFIHLTSTKGESVNE